MTVTYETHLQRMNEDPAYKAMIESATRKYFDKLNDRRLNAQARREARIQKRIEDNKHLYQKLVPLVYKGKSFPGYYLCAETYLPYSDRRCKGIPSPVKFNKKGYPIIRYNDGTVNHNLRVHIAVMSTFSPIEQQSEIKGVPSKILELAKKDPEILQFLYHSLEVNHINHIPEDFNLKNLEWVTTRENANAYHNHAGFR